MKYQYEALKNEMDSLVNIQTTYTIAMYTLTVAVLAFEMQYDKAWPLLFPYVFLFSFQRAIQSKKYIMLRISSYIAVYIDDDEGYEKNYENISKLTKKSKKYSFIRSILSGRLSSAQLGWVTALFTVIWCFSSQLNTDEKVTLKLMSIIIKERFAITNWIVIFIAFSCTVILTIFSMDSFDGMEKRNYYINNLKKFKDNKITPDCYESIVNYSARKLIRSDKRRYKEDDSTLNLFAPNVFDRKFRFQMLHRYASGTKYEEMKGIIIGILFRDKYKINKNVICGKELLCREHVIIKEGVFIGNHVTIGADARIYENVIIEDNVTIGDRCSVGPNIRISKGITVPTGTEVKMDL